MQRDEIFLAPALPVGVWLVMKLVEVNHRQVARFGNRHRQGGLATVGGAEGGVDHGGNQLTAPDLQRAARSRDRALR